MGRGCTRSFPCGRSWTASNGVDSCRWFASTWLSVTARSWHSIRAREQREKGLIPMNSNQALWEKGDFTRGQLDELFTSQNTSKDATSIPATFLRVTVAL